MIRIIPCLDVAQGRVVKGVNFQNLRDVGSPSELAKRYERDGADELVFLDISATVEGRNAQERWINEVRSALSIPLTVGGAVDSIARAELLLKAGADKVSTNSAAVSRPELIRELAEQFGRQCIVLAIDAKRDTDTKRNSSWKVVTHSGKKVHDIDAIKWAKRGVELGAGEILLTSWDRDGTGSGYDVELIKLVSKATGVPIVASGGAKTTQHLADAVFAGASAVLAASIFHDGVFSISEVKLALRNLGISVRLEESLKGELR
jgi:imidazole glycerol-phosphate synthase subunit HisF